MKDKKRDIAGISSSLNFSREFKIKQNKANKQNPKEKLEVKETDKGKEIIQETGKTASVFSLHVHLCFTGTCVSERAGLDLQMLFTCCFSLKYMCKRGHKSEVIIFAHTWSSIAYRTEQREDMKKFFVAV